MKTNAIYPGTFDPITYGHIDVIKKALKFVNTLIVAVSDFEYEFQLAGMNRKLNNKVETIFLMSDIENQIISSRFVKEIALHKGDLKKFTTKSTIISLKERYA